MSTGPRAPITNWGGSPRSNGTSRRRSSGIASPWRSEESIWRRARRRDHVSPTGDDRPGAAGFRRGGAVVSQVAGDRGEAGNDTGPRSHITNWDSRPGAAGLRRGGAVVSQSRWRSEEKLGNEHSAASTYHQLGRIAQEQRDFAAAEPWYRKSLAIKEKQGNEHGAASTYGQLGILAGRQGHFIDSGQWLIKAIVAFHRSRDPQNVRQAGQNFLVTYRNAPPLTRPGSRPCGTKPDSAPSPSRAPSRLWCAARRGGLAPWLGAAHAVILRSPDLIGTTKDPGSALVQWKTVSLIQCRDSLRSLP